LREEDEDDAQGNQEASEEVAQAVSEMEHAYCADDGNNIREGEARESSDRPSSSDPSDDSRVRFGDIEICEHGMILGDHPGKFLVLG
jgi:hypothetical protein